eukprot:COSAG05_NODE_68_length_22188_cov_8.265019_4_plen_1086_part_00
MILKESAEVLMDQVYNVKNTLVTGKGAPEFLVDKKYKSLCERLVKRFPEAPLDLTEQDSALLLAIAPALCDELGPYIDTLAGAEEVGREIVSILSEMLNHSITGVMAWETNPALVSDFFTLLTKYAQLNILAGGVEETTEPDDIKRYRRNLRVIVTAQAKAKELLGEYEDRFSDTAAYLHASNDAIVFLQEKLQPHLCPKIGHCLMGLRELLCGGIDWDGHRQAQIFSVARMLQKDEMLRQPLPGQLLRLRHLQLSKQVVEWIEYAFLVCPGELSAQGQDGFKLFRMCLHQGTCLSVYRDEYLDIHERLKAVDKIHRLDKQWMDMTKDKKYLSDVKHYSRDHAADWHRHRRVALALEMESMIEFFVDMPTLTGPKVELLLAVLRTCRDEIVWFFQDWDVPDSKDWPPKSWTGTPDERREWEMHRVPDLLYYHDRISQLLLQNQQNIATYWCGMMQKVYSAELGSLLAGAGAEVAMQEPRVKKIIDANRNTLANAAVSTDFFPFRLNWQRVNAFWSSPQCPGCNLTNPVGSQIDTKMRQIASNSEFVDSLPRLIQEASLGQLFWYRRAYRQLFQSSLNFKRPVASPRHALAFVKHVSTFANCVPTHFAVECAAVGSECADLSKRMLESVADTAKILVDHIFTESNVLSNQLTPENAVSVSNGPSYTEKEQIRAVATKKVAGLKRHLELLCAAVAETPSISIYNRTFYPREFLRVHLATALRRQIWDRSWFDLEFERMERPSVVKEYLVRYVRVLATVEEVVSIDVSEMLRAVLISVTYNPEVSKLFPDDERQQFSLSYLGPPAEGEFRSLPLCIAKWMVNLLAKVSVAGSIQYSEFCAGLVSGSLMDGRQAPDPRDFRAEEFCDISELEAVCFLVGPYGVKLIEHELLQFVQTQVVKMDAWMKERELPCDMFSKTWETETSADQFSQQLEGDARVLITAGVNAGLALCVRKQLHAALRSTLGSSNSQLLDCIDMAHRFASNGLKHNAAVKDFPELEAAARMGFDAGVVTGPTDYALRRALADLNTDARAASRWETLPFVFAATMGTEVWMQAKYNARIGGPCAQRMPNIATARVCSCESPQFYCYY